MSADLEKREGGDPVVIERKIENILIGSIPCYMYKLCVFISYKSMDYI